MADRTSEQKHDNYSVTVLCIAKHVAGHRTAFYSRAVNSNAILCKSIIKLALPFVKC